MQQLTALQIVNRAASELGLQRFAEVASSSELTGQQMLSLLNAAGNDLMMAYPWSRLIIIYDFNTVASQSAYVLPSDYGYYIDQTMWNISQKQPIAGPATPQEWQTLRSNSVGSSFSQTFRVAGKSISIYPTPATANSCTYEYISSNWVISGPNPSVTQQEIVSDSDVPAINSELMIKALKVKMWNAKGLDTNLLISEYTELFNFLTGKDKGARVLSVSSPIARTSANTPNSGFGSQ